MPTQSPDSLHWGSYKEFEGPYSHGTQPYVCPENPELVDMICSTITATEGGNWNALNMYDTCILTMGLIQWCDASYFAVTSMLEAVYRQNPDLLAPLQPAMDASQVTFEKTPDNTYRFRFKDGHFVTTRILQQKLYFLNATGEKGSWDEASKSHARLWGACVSNVFDQPEAIEIEKKYTFERLDLFVQSFAKSVIHKAPDDAVGNAFRCAYYSFAANNPSWANSNLSIAMQSSQNAPYSIPWLIDVLKQLTFGPQCTIYPDRYNKIRPVLEKFFGLDLPDFSTDISKWNGKLPYSPLCSIKEIQAALVKLNFDIGKSGPNHDGVDGVDGKKTRVAIYAFQKAWGMEFCSAWCDEQTHIALHDALAALDNMKAGNPIDEHASWALHSMGF